MKATIVKLTPEVAKQYLSNNKNNRPVSIDTVNRYVSDMKNGRWKENGEAIIIDTSACIRDGQHRLEATIKAEHTWFVPIVTQVEPNVMDTIDTGKNRSLTDVLALEGYQYSSALASIITRILKYNENAHGNAGTLKKHYTNAIGLEFASNNREWIMDVTKMADKLYSKQAIKVFSRSDIGLFIYIITGGQNIDNAFFVKFMNMVTGIIVDELTAVSWFYKKMVYYKTSKESVRSKWKIGIFIKCWNLYIEGNPPVKRMTFNVDNDLPAILKPEVEVEA